MQRGIRWAIAMAWGPAWVAAQQQSTTSDTARQTQLPTVQIEATLAPSQTHRVRLNDMASQMPQLSLAEGLRLVPGVQVEDRRNLSQSDRISLRGVGARAQFGVRGIRIDFDGVPLTFADGQSQVNLLDLAWTSSVQVDHGPAALSHGNSAGGRIQYQKTDPAQGWRTTWRGSVGTGGLNRQSLWLGLGDRLDRRASWLGVSHTGFDGIRPNGGGRFFNLGGGTMFRLAARTSLTLTALTYFAPWLENPGTLNWTDVLADARQTRAVVQTQGAGKTVSQGVLAATLARATVQPWSLTVHGGWRNTDNSIVGTFIALPRIAGGGRYAQRFGWETFALHVGSEVNWLQDQRREYAQPIRANALPPRDWRQIGSGERGARTTDQTETVVQGSASALATWLPSDAWQVKVGLRAEGWTFDARDHLRPSGVNYSGTRRLGQFSPGASVRYQSDPRIWAQVSVSQGLIAPTTTELSNRPDGAGGFSNLQPERIRQVELSTGGTRGSDSAGVGLTWQISAFAAQWHDQLVPFTLPGPTEIVYFQNAARSRTLGLEASAQAWLRQWLNIKGQMSWIDARFQDFPAGGRNNRGRFVPGVAPLRTTLWLQAMRPDVGWNGTVIWQHTAPTWANDANGGPLAQSFYRAPAQHRLDVRVGYGATFVLASRPLAWQLWAGVDNATGTRLLTVVPNFAGSRFFEPLPGRQWAAGLVLSM